MKVTDVNQNLITPKPGLGDNFEEPQPQPETPKKTKRPLWTPKTPDDLTEQVFLSANRTNSLMIILGSH